MQRGQIAFARVTIKEGQRLDKIAHDFYGDARLWWIIAAASGIGWWLQMPEDIVLYIPTNLDEISNLKGLG